MMIRAPSLRFCLLLTSLFFGLGWQPRFAKADDVADVFPTRIQPLLRQFCLECHNTEKTRGELDLSSYATNDDVTADFRQWESVIEFVRTAKMPPEDAEQPSVDQRRIMVRSLESILLEEARKHAGDPGVILPRRLSNTEYDLSVRDLIGVDVRPTRDFPADPAAGEGFDNTGEALGMSPSLLKKYLTAAERVAEHLVLKTDGIAFAPFPVTSYNERKKLTEQAVIQFYNRHEVRVIDYLAAAWRYQHRADELRDVSLEGWAKREGLSLIYLRSVWDLLEEAKSSKGVLQQIGTLWRAVPPPSAAGNLPQALVELERFIEFNRRELGHHEESLIRSNAGNWPISHLDFRARTANLRGRFDSGSLVQRRVIVFDRLRVPRGKQSNEPAGSLYLRIDGATNDQAGTFVVLHRPMFSKANKLPRNADESRKHETVTLRSFLEQHASDVGSQLKFGVHPRGDEIDADSLVVRAPAMIELPLTTSTLQQLDGKQLLVDCEVDATLSPSGAVYLRHGIGASPPEPNSVDSQLIVVPETQFAKEFAESAARFCETFPNRFYYVDARRGLAAGFHLVEGFFRDDQPLVDKVLNHEQRRELDRLWDELHFVTNSTETLIRGFVWFERSERHVLHDERFDFLRAGDPRLVQDSMLNRFERVYLERMNVKLVEGRLEPQSPSDRFAMIHGFFDQIRGGLKRHREQMQTAETRALDNLNALAGRAYRRPLTQRDKAALRSLYQRLRDQGQNVEQALRATLTAVLMSPDFCYRYATAREGAGVYPLDDVSLASRMSYFLWSSLPDDALRGAAERGELQDQAVRTTQLKRMLKDDRMEAFAREFLGQWLRFRDYLEKDPINADSFKGVYDEELRQAMFDEPVRLAAYLIQNDRPITDLLGSDVTFLNGRLARHYGGEIESSYRRHLVDLNSRSATRRKTDGSQSAEPWLKVEGIRKAGRGGLFGMGVILTKNSSGERTSPVKRGFWTVHHLLGQHFPPPPADVPELPATEKEATSTIREMLAEHTANPRCAMCHNHFDGLGLALEGFDPIGRRRQTDLAGRSISDQAELSDGQTFRGIGGLIDYVESKRRADFVRTFCRKFLGYALGRSVLLSDQPLLREMEKALQGNDYRFSVAFEMVVNSRQFLEQRGRDYRIADR